MLSPRYYVFGRKNLKKFIQKKKQSGNRKYTPENVLTIQYIYHLVKEKGLTLQGAKKQLNLKAKDTPQKALLSKLEKIKTDLQKLRKKL